MRCCKLFQKYIKYISLPVCSPPVFFSIDSRSGINKVRGDMAVTGNSQHSASHKHWFGSPSPPTFPSPHVCTWLLTRKRGDLVFSFCDHFWWARFIFQRVTSARGDIYTPSTTVWPLNTNLATQNGTHLLSHRSWESGVKARMNFCLRSSHKACGRGLHISSES